MSESFEEAFANTCESCGEALEWEWDGGDLMFRTSCCARKYTLMPIGGAVDCDSSDVEDEVQEEE